MSNTSNDCWNVHFQALKLSRRLLGLKEYELSIVMSTTFFNDIQYKSCEGCPNKNVPGHKCGGIISFLEETGHGDKVHLLK